MQFKNFFWSSLVVGMVAGSFWLYSNMAEVIQRRPDVYAPKGHSLTRQKQANTDVLRFPVDLDGASSVKKYIVPGAERYIVHVKNGVSGSNKQELLDYQKNLYNLLLDMNTRLEVRDVFYEGMTPEDKLILTRMADEKRILLQNGFYLKHALEGESALYQLEGILNQNSVFRLMVEDRLNALVTEDPKLYETAKKTYYTIKSGILPILHEEYRYNYGMLNEKRLDHILVKASQREDKMSVVITNSYNQFGGRLSCGVQYDPGERNYIDNIQQWNNEHVKNRFSLIEVSVEGYQSLSLPHH